MDPNQLNGSNFHDSNLFMIQEYLESGGDPNFQLYGGVTVFIEAVSFPSDNIRVVNELINAGADLNLSTHLGYTPLLLAVRHRKRRVVQALIQSGASVNAKDFLGQTVLHHAVREWVLDLPETSIEYYPDIWIINELLTREDIDCNQVDFYGETPLMSAVMDQQIEITNLLLRNNANPNIGNELSVTPLHVAFSQLENYMGMELLLCGASIYSVDKRGRTPVDVLLENGLDIRNNEMVIDILKTIAFKCFITSDLKRKFQLIPHLSQVFNQYCKEADHMRGDFIYGNITMHDFMWDCFEEKIPDIHDIHIQQINILQIHKAVVERLVRDIYPEYFIDIIVKIPKSILRQILQVVAERKRRVSGIAYLFSISLINELISVHLSHDQIFAFICAFWCDNF